MVLIHKSIFLFPKKIDKNKILTRIFLINISDNTIMIFGRIAIETTVYKNHLRSKLNFKYKTPYGLQPFIVKSAVNFNMVINYF